MGVFRLRLWDWGTLERTKISHSTLGSVGGVGMDAARTQTEHCSNKAKHRYPDSDT